MVFNDQLYEFKLFKTVVFIATYHQLHLENFTSWCRLFTFRRVRQKTAKSTEMKASVNMLFYNIASRAAQSNSVYVSVLKIQIVLADGVSKFFFARAALVSAGKNIIFRYNNEYKQRLDPLVAKRRQLSNLFSVGLEFKWGKRREKQWKRKLGISSVTIRFTVRG